MQNVKVSGKVLSLDQNKLQYGSNSIDSPVELKYGSSPIEIDMFCIGTRYQIKIRNQDLKTVVLSFNTYFGFRKELIYNQYQTVLDLIWDAYFSNLYELYIEQWENGESLVCGNFEISINGITKRSLGVNEKIMFDDMRVIRNYDSLVINSISDSNRYMLIRFLDDWNWPLIYNILEIRGIIS